MNKNAIVIFSITNLLLLLLIIGLFFRTPRIGVIDVATVFANFSESVNAGKEFEMQKAKLQKVGQSIEDSLKVAMDKMNKEYPNASQSKRKELEKKIGYWNKEFSQFVKSSKLIKAKKEQELMAPVMQKVESFIQTWGPENGYDVILGTGTGGVIFHAGHKQNVTAEVIDELNKLYGYKAEKASSVKKDNINKKEAKPADAK